jgi:hypothetical protein
MLALKNGIQRYVVRDIVHRLFGHGLLDFSYMGRGYREQNNGFHSISEYKGLGPDGMRNHHSGLRNRHCLPVRCADLLTPRSSL